MNDDDELDELERELGTSVRLGLRRAAAEITEEHRPHALSENDSAARGTRLDETDLEALEPQRIEVVVDLEPTPPKRAERRRWLVAIAAAATVVLIVGTVLVWAAPSHNTETRVPASPGPVTTTDPPSGLKGLGPEEPTPLAPENRLVADLPMPIWIYEGGRVISAHWNSPDDWTGFLEQRLTPEGVELVRAEIRASRPSHEGCKAGGPGGYAYIDGERSVCEHASALGISLRWDQVYPRLSELPSGAHSWLPANAWADPEPKPYVASKYHILIKTDGGPNEALSPIDASAVTALLPPEAAKRLTEDTPCRLPFTGHESMCFDVTTQEARQVAAALGVDFDNRIPSASLGKPHESARTYAIMLLPYLPHDAPVFCCAG